MADCGRVEIEGGVPYCRVNDVLQGSFVACQNATDVGKPCCVGAKADIDCAPFITPTATPRPTLPPAAPTPTTDPASPMSNPFSAPRREFFDMVDPLQVGGGQTIRDEAPSAYANTLRSPGGIVSRALQFIFPLAGLILFLMLVWGGFEMLIGAPTKKSMESGRNRVTAAIVGFLLLFSSYWIWQIIEIVFGVKIL